MDAYEQAAEKIIKEQENIVGPLALEQAKKASGLEVDDHIVKFTGDRLKALDSLVEQYKQLFGQTSVEVCKDAAQSFFTKLPPNQIPSLLR
jgi:hypothetical protein